MIKARLYDILVSPHISEKTTEANGQFKYTFKVSEFATKLTVCEAVDKIFGVKPDSVNILNVKSKAKVFKGRKGTRSGFKKAVVTLPNGKTLDLGSGV